MDNKQQITANNAELQKHKQDILDLPFADDVKNGRYVWERTENPYVQNPTMTADSTISGAMHFTSTDIDLSKATEPFFDGFAHSTGEYYFEYADGALIYHRQGAAIPVTYDPARQAIIGTTGGGVFSYDGVKNADGKPNQYVVANEHDEYPSNGEKGDYFYKKPDKPVMGIDFGEVTLVSSNNHIIVSHNLGKVPGRAYLVPDKGILTKSGYSYLNIYGQVLKNSSPNMELSDVLLRYITVTENSIDFGTAGNIAPFYKGTYKWFALA